MATTQQLDLRNFCIAQIAVITIAVVLGLVAYVFAELLNYDMLPDVLQAIDVGHERSIQTYLSTVNLLLASALLFVIFRHEKGASRENWRYWLFLSVLFLFLSFDEFASIHEKYSRIYERFVDSKLKLPVFESHQWLPIGILFVLVVFAFLLPFLRGLAKKTRAYFMTAGLVFITGAIGFEFLGALMLYEGVVDSRYDLIYRIRRLFEESMEMYGVVIFNCALYREIVRKKILLKIGAQH